MSFIMETEVIITIRENGDQPYTDRRIYFKHHGIVYFINRSQIRDQAYHIIDESKK